MNHVMKTIPKLYGIYIIWCSSFFLLSIVFSLPLTNMPLKFIQNVMLGAILCMLGPVWIPSYYARFFCLLLLWLQLSSRLHFIHFLVVNRPISWLFNSIPWMGHSCVSIRVVWLFILITYITLFGNLRSKFKIKKKRSKKQPTKNYIYRIHSELEWPVTSSIVYLSTGMIHSLQTWWICV